MKERLETRNAYGARDLTPYNAANRMGGNGAALMFGGIQFDGLKQYELPPTDVMNGCAELGIKISARTLQRHTKAGLVTMPYRKGGGRGVGTVSLYRADAPAEIYASEKLRRRWSVERVAEIRAIACVNDKKAFWLQVFNSPDNLAAAAWLYYYAEALKEKMPVAIFWKTQKQMLGSDREITLEVFPTRYHDSPAGFDFLELLNKKTISEKDDPEKFKEWQAVLHDLEQ